LKKFLRRFSRFDTIPAEYAVPNKSQHITHAQHT